MRQTANQVIVVYFVMAAIVAVTLVGQEPIKRPAEKPKGDADAISEWGLSGVVWSEANFVHKLAAETAKADSSLTSEQIKKLEQVTDDSKALIESMERFGWRRLRRAPGATTPSGTGSSLSERDLPDPKAVGAQLAESMGIEATEPNEETTQKQDQSSATMRDKTKNPAEKDKLGRAVPGTRDQRTSNRLRIDINQYRVDNYIDKTPGSSRSLADARADGIKGAMIAANPDVMAGLNRARISQREAQTQSSSMAYSGSIYDADDYDPDGDSIVGNALTRPEIVGPSTANEPAKEAEDSAASKRNSPPGDNSRMEGNQKMESNRVQTGRYKSIH